jgi:hypothetical protein
MKARLAGIALLAASLAGAAVAGAQETAPGLSLRIETERPGYSLGEPVYLTARLTNSGPQEARFLAMLNPMDGLLTVSVRDPKGEGVGYMPLSARDRDTPPSALPPGGEIATTFPIFFGADGWVFEKPGRYAVVASFHSQGGAGETRMIRSNPLEITIREEGADAGRFLMEGPAGLEAGRFLVWRGGDQLERGLARLRELAERYPDSPAVDHYRVALGRSLARPFKNYSKGAVRPADYPRALEELGRARDETLPARVRVEKYLGQATSFLGTEKAGEAAEALGRVRALIAERVGLADFREQLERLERYGAGRKE